MKILRNTINSFFGLLICVFLYSANINAQTEDPDVHPLPVGETLERQIMSGRPHHYTIDLTPGQVLQVELVEKGIDVRIRLYRIEDSKTVLRVNLGSGYDRERLTAIIEQGGTYSVVVTTLETDAIGSYIISPDVRPSATQTDKEQIDAERLLAEGILSNDKKTTVDRQEAIAKCEQSLGIWEKLDNNYWKAYTYNFIGRLYYSLNEKIKALEKFKQALTFYEKAEDPGGKAFALTNIGIVYYDLGGKQKALHQHEQALQLFIKTTNPKGQINSIHNIAVLSSELGDKPGALRAFNQALDFYIKTVNLIGQAGTLYSIGEIYSYLGEKQKALDLYDRAFWLFEKKDNPKGLAITLNGIGAVYFDLGDKQTALEKFKQALPLRVKATDLRGQAVTLNNIGETLSYLGNKEEALIKFNEALTIRRTLKDLRGQAITLNNIGGTYLDLGQKEKARDSFDEALQLSELTEDLNLEATTINNIGAVYDNMGDKRKALDHYLRALPISIRADNLRGEARILRNIMIVLSILGNPKLAIFYGKMSLICLQSLRGNVKGNDLELEKTFLRSIQDYYRISAELLIKEKQFDQALQVLNLSRDQQYFDFNSDIDHTAEPVNLSDREQEFVKRYDVVSEKSRRIDSQIAELEQQAFDREPTEAEIARLRDLKNSFKSLDNEFLQIFKDAEPGFSGSRDEKDQILVAGEVRNILNTLKNSEQTTAIVYTLIAANQFHLLLISKNGIKHFSVPVKESVINEKSKEFAAILKNLDPSTGKPNIDVTDQAKELYDIIFRPIEKDLPANITTILWSLDGNLRYVPISALHDGKEYLVRRKLNNVIFTRSDIKRAASLPEFSRKATGFAVSEEKKQVKNSDIPYDFPALIGSEAEINGIFSIGNTKNLLLEGKPFLNAAFTKEVMLRELRKELPIVHISSHFKIQPGDLSRSFLVLGDGTSISLLDMKTEAKTFPEGKLFAKVDLLTLSACDTGIAEADSNGREVDSFAELAQRLGAASVMATLWSVNECSTAELMKLFYDNRINKKMNKAEALRQAQLAMLDGTIKSTKGCGAGKGKEKNWDKPDDYEQTKSYRIFKEDPAKPFSHPYYWAPVILYGNWK